MATTYHHGQAHRLLATAAGDLIERFTISTKVSPRAGLPPLREQAARAVDELGTVPTVVLVHNPEHIVRALPPDQAARWWHDTAEVMTELVASGLCRAWGLACWDPRPLLPLLPSPPSDQAPPPAVAMIRAGLLVPSDVLTASDELLDQLKIEHEGRWGMSPFAGEPTLLAGAGIHQFLGHDAPSCRRPAVALATAWHLPSVSRIAVGTSHPQHLAELAAAVEYPVDGDRITRYRQRLTAHTRAG